MNTTFSLPAKPPQLPFKSSSSFKQTKHRKLHLNCLNKELVHLASSNRLNDAIATIKQLSRGGIPADPVSCSILLRSCIRSRDLKRGRLIHRHLVDSGTQLDSVLYNSLITLYSKCGEWDTAYKLFDEMGISRDLVSWTTMITSAAQNKMEQTAICIFYEMLEYDFFPNEYTFSSVIQACSNGDYASVGRVVLGLVIKAGFFAYNVSVGCSLVDMFAKTQDLTSARRVFDSMVERNLVMWTLMITRYSQNGFGKEAVDLFIRMYFDGFEPDRFTLSSVISTCAEMGSLRLGQQLHSFAVRAGLTSDVCVSCSLVDMYAKCSHGGSMIDSRKVFDRMPEHNVMSWTAIITGYVQNGGHDEEAIRIFHDMLVQGDIRPNHFTYSSVLKACSNLSKPFIGEQIYAHVVKSGLSSVNVVGNSLVTMYSRSGWLEEARKAFNLLYEKNMVSLSAIIDGYVKNSDSIGAFDLFHQMDSMDIGVSSFTFASLLSAAASVGIMSKGLQLHAQLIKVGFESDKAIGNALISMYSRCGDIEDAWRVFSEMCEKNVISWTSMITGLAKHGLGNRALKLYNKMTSSGAEPNEVTYIAVLTACSHVGLVNEAWEHFNSMQSDYGIVPRMEHYACMVDVLGRCGALKEGLEFIKSMPFKADALVWRTLLAACRIHGNMVIGKEAAENILQLDPNDPAAHVLLSNLNAMEGQWNEVAKIRSAMKERKLDKEAGLSWIEIDNTLHKFHVGDTSHPLSQEIFKKLHDLVSEIKKMGYKPDTSYVLHDIEDELKEQFLLQHSEKLAVAFGLISTSTSRPIRIFKNLRVCGDCHNAMKFISKATGREIILRDSNRFHQLRNGDCSCGDYW